jgi:hypothetical protein
VPKAVVCSKDLTAFSVALRRHPIQPRPNVEALAGFCPEGWEPIAKSNQGGANAE